MCPYMSDYNELLAKEFYPFLSKQWDNLLEIHYEKKNVARRLKFTKDEFINQGYWKSGASKEYFLINKKATPERIRELSELKGCSEEVASKYFNRQCKCGKKLNSDEVGMYLRMFGKVSGAVASIEQFNRQVSFFGEDIIYSEDDTKYLCKDCFCKAMGITKAQYDQKVRDFRNGGCTLF